MNQYHNVEKIEFSNDKLYIKVDSNEYVIDVSNISDKLEKASNVERERFEISPSGYGIHWPLLDEDLSIDGLLGIKHRPVETKEMVEN